MVVASTSALAGISPAHAATGSCYGLAATINATSGTLTTGTPGRDVIVGSSGPDEINGAGGNDVICGYGGDDEIFGGAGNDIIFGNRGNDIINGGSGNDRLYGRLGDDEVNGNFGQDIVYGDAGHDTLTGGAAWDRIYGGDGDDHIDGGNTRDYLHGGNGNDVLDGAGGADTFIGGPGTNTCVEDGRPANASECAVECYGNWSVNNLLGNASNDINRTYQCRFPSAWVDVYFNISENEPAEMIHAALNMTTAALYYRQLGMTEPREDVILATVGANDIVGGSGLSYPIGRIQVEHTANFTDDLFTAHEMFHQFQWAHLAVGSGAASDGRIFSYFAAVPGVRNSAAQYLESMAEAGALEFEGRGCGANCAAAVNAGPAGAPWEPEYSGAHYFQYLRSQTSVRYPELLDSLRITSGRVVNLARDSADSLGALGPETHPAGYWAWALNSPAFNVEATAVPLNATSRADRTVQSSSLGRLNHIYRVSHGVNKAIKITNTGSTSVTFAFVDCKVGDSTGSIELGPGQSVSLAAPVIGSNVCAESWFVIGQTLGEPGDIAAISFRVESITGTNGGIN